MGSKREKEVNVSQKKRYSNRKRKETPKGREYDKRIKKRNNPSKKRRPVSPEKVIKIIEKNIDIINQTTKPNLDQSSVLVQTCPCNSCKIIRIYLKGIKQNTPHHVLMEEMEKCTKENHPLDNQILTNDMDEKKPSKEELDSILQDESSISTESQSVDDITSGSESQSVDDITSESESEGGNNPQETSYSGKLFEYGKRVVRNLSPPLLSTFKIFT